MTETIERIVLASRPVGEPTLDNFRSEKLPIPHLGSDEMLLRTLWLSLDPYMRGRMSDAPSYAKPVGIGDVMEGGTVSEVGPAVRHGQCGASPSRLASIYQSRRFRPAKGRPNAGTYSDCTGRSRNARNARLHGTA